MSDTFRLTVVKRVPNPHYMEQVEEERRQWVQSRERNHYNSFDNPPPLFMPSAPQVIDERTLEIEVTADEYNAIKEAVLETFK